MEDANRDSQDSESSSTSSWILINDETVDDNVSEEIKSTLFKEAIQNASEIDFKNNQSDIESDGISVISESEFFHGRSDDDATVSESEKWDIKEDSNHENDETHEVTEIEKNDYVLATETPEQISESSNELEIFQSAEEVTDVTHLSTNPSEDTPQEISLANCLCDLAQKYNFNRLLTWPSLLGTSIVILAVLIYPFYSIDLNIYNEQCEIEHDVQMLPDDKIDKLDPHLYCEQIHKKDTPFSDYDFENCVKIILKRKRKIAKNKIREIHFDKNLDNGGDGIMGKKVSLDDGNGKENENRRYLRSYLSHIYDRLLGIKHRNSKNDMNQKHSANVVESTDDPNRTEFSKEALRGKSEEDIIRHIKKLIMEDARLLFDKEIFLYQWEKKLIEREKRIKEHENNIDTIKPDFSRKKSTKDMKYKGDFDDQYTLRHFKKFKEEKFDSDEKPKRKGDGKNYSNKSTKMNQNDIHKNSNDNYGKKRKNYYQKEIFGKYKRKGDTEYFQKRDMYSKPQVNFHAEHKYKKIQNNPKKNQTRLLDDDNVTVTGEWYLNLNEGRRDIRKKEEKALWWFERAEYRRNKRNKAYWYFQYMFNRENLRTRPKNI